MPKKKVFSERKSNEEVGRKDKCMMCDNETDYTPDIHESDRIGYIEGLGQLCRNCYRRIYSGEDISEG